MRVYVNGKAVDLLTGMTVRHALIQAGILEEVSPSQKVYDEWGNEMGLAGALSEGMKIVLKPNRDGTGC